MLLFKLYAPASRGPFFVSDLGPKQRSLTKLVLVWVSFYWVSIVGPCRARIASFALRAKLGPTCKGLIYSPNEMDRQGFKFSSIVFGSLWCSRVFGSVRSAHLPPSAALVAIRMSRRLRPPKSNVPERCIDDLTDEDWNHRFEVRAGRIRRILASPAALVAARNPRCVLPPPPQPDVRMASYPWDQQYRAWRDTIYFIFYDYI